MILTLCVDSKNSLWNINSCFEVLSNGPKLLSKNTKCTCAHKMQDTPSHCHSTSIIIQKLEPPGCEIESCIGLHAHQEFALLPIVRGHKIYIL